MKIVLQFQSEGLPVLQACKIAGMSKSTFYNYSKEKIKTDKKRGRRPPGYSLNKTGEVITDIEIVKEIEEINTIEYLDYGYLYTTAELKNRGLRIKKEKVYRLMAENNLLKKRRRSKAANKKFVQWKDKPIPKKPLEVLQIDLKYIYIHGIRRNAYLATLIDTFTSEVLIWDLSLSMKSKDIWSLIEKAGNKFKFNEEVKVTMISDNGPQFISKALRERIDHQNIDHLFIKYATPQMNAYIESYHSRVQKLVCDKFEFIDLEHAKLIMIEFVETYNNQRINKSLAFYSPIEFKKQWKEGKIIQIIGENNKYYFKRKKQCEEHTVPFLSEVFYLGNTKMQEKTIPLQNRTN